MNAPAVQTRAEPRAECSPARRVQWRAMGRAALVFFLVLLFLTTPVAAPDNTVDGSLGTVLSHAHEKAWQYGRDVVFTYGPLGFLMFFYYTPHLAGFRSLVDLVLCLGVAAGLVRLAWRMPMAWRFLLLGYFAWVAPNVHGRGDFVINTGLCCWGLLCALESGRRLVAAAVAMTVLVAFAAAAKVSFLFFAPMLLLLISLDLWIRRERRIALGIPGGFAVLFLLAWIGSGQRLANLPQFARNSLAVINAYNQALGYEGLWPVLIAGLVAAGGLAATLILRAGMAFAPDEPNRAARRVLLLSWTSLLGLVVWKHGFVRQDHAFYFLAFAPVLALAAEAVPASSRRAVIIARSCTVLVCIGGITGLGWAQFPEFPTSLIEPWKSLWKSTRTLLFPAPFHRAQQDGVSANWHQAQLPRLQRIIGDATVDVFGQSQAYALHNGFNYRPRPVFQSYVACSRALIELNERFYLSPDRPEFVLLALEPMDSKVAALEDSRVLRELLFHYRHVTNEGPYLLCQAARPEPLQLERVLAGRVRPGQRITLPHTDDPLWLEVSMRPSLTGYVRRWLLRPPVVRLALWGSDGTLMARRRAPASMLESGFLLSPFILNHSDLSGLLQGDPGRRPESWAIEVLPGEEKFWQDRIQFSVCRIKHRIGGAPAGAGGAYSASGTSKEPASARPFKLFRTSRWRPDQPPIGGWGEQVALGLFILAPFCFLAALWFVATRVRTRQTPVTWSAVAKVNLLLFGTLLSLLLLGGELYYRFACDSTDSLGYTKVSERWVARHWKVNSAGCRDNIDYSPAATPGKRRVTFVGDSFTAGHGIADVEDRLVNLWRRAHPDWETHALTNVGLDTGGELALLKKAVSLGYQLDRVVLVYCLNDIGDLLPQEETAFQGALAGVNQAGWWPRNSYFINAWYHRFLASRSPYLKDYGTHSLNAYRGATWEQQRQRFEEIRDFVREHGGQLAVVTYPFFHALGPDYPYISVHRQLQEAWTSLQVPHLDLLSAFEGLPREKLTVNARDAHPNEEANRIAADRLLEWAAPSMP